MGEPTCRSCWLASLPDSERQRVAAEPVTSCVYLCAPHQAEMDALLRAFAPFEFIKAAPPTSLAFQEIL